MNDHQRLLRIWIFELNSRQIREELGRWNGLLQRRSDKIRQCHLDIKDHQTVIDDLDSTFPKWDDDLKKLDRRVKLVEDGIQSGLMQNLEQAQLQIDEFKLRKESLEEQYLNAMETQESLSHQQLLSKDTIKATRQMLTKESDQFALIQPNLDNELDEINEQSESLLSQMNPAVSKLYRLMLPAKPRAVAGVVKNTCGACVRNLPTELHWVATQRETICHCPFCRVFLLPEEPEIPERFTK